MKVFPLEKIVCLCVCGSIINIWASVVQMVYLIINSFSYQKKEENQWIKSVKKHTLTTTLPKWIDDWKKKERFTLESCCCCCCWIWLNKQTNRNLLIKSTSYLDENFFNYFHQSRLLLLLFYWQTSFWTNFVFRKKNHWKSQD